MSIDEAGSGGKAPEITATLSSPAGKAAVKDAVKGTRSRPAKVRKHSTVNVSWNNLAAYLDKLHAEGGVLVALNIAL